MITELELISKFADWSAPGAAGIAFSESRAVMRDGEIVFVGVAELAGIEFRYRADIGISVESGEMRLELKRLQIGQLFAPGLVRTAMVGFVTRLLDAGVPRPPIDIETLLISEGEIVISGSTRGL